MITLGYITKLNDSDSNLFEVRLPIFEKAGTSSLRPDVCGSFFKANLGYNPGNLNAYKVGDCVVVGFLNNKYAEPVILGKLYTGDEQEATNYSFNNALVVTESAKLPKNTKIGNLSLESLMSVLRQADGLETRLDKLDGEVFGGMPTIRVTSLSKGLHSADATKYFDEGDTVNLNVVVSGGQLQVGDEITICERCKSNEHNSRQRYRYRVVKKLDITSSNVNNTEFSIPITHNVEDEYVYKHNNKILQSGPAIRFVRVRRKIPKKNTAIYSNIETIRLSMGNRTSHEETHTYLTLV